MARRRAVFGDDATGSSADERDDADRLRESPRDDRWYDEERPPHHGSV